MKKILIIGFGSIGKKHAKIFRDLGAKVSIVTKQSIDIFSHFDNISEAIKKFSPEIVFICNETSKHFQTISELKSLHFSGPIIVEKPLAKDSFVTTSSFTNIYVSYNLRFHKIINYLKLELSDKNIISSLVYCGQYLPSWRPNSDYTKSYSADISSGGGALRDLSHELDYSLLLFGKFSFLTAIGGHFSKLEITSDDNFTIVGKTERCQNLTITLNYLDRVATRFLIINTDQCTYRADLITGHLYVNGDLIIDQCNIQETYTIQAQNILNNNFDNFCSCGEGLITVKHIEAVELSALNNQVIYL